MKKTIVIISILFLNAFLTHAQNSPTFDIAAGWGFSDAFHIGLKGQFSERNQFGLYYGNMLVFHNQTYNSLILDHQYHFGKVSNLSNRRVWFIREGLTYAVQDDDYSTINYLLLNFNIGREINITPRTGFTFDLGLFRPILEHEKIKDPTQKPWFNIELKDFVILPNFRIQFFYSF